MYYFFTNSKGEQIYSGITDIGDNPTLLELSPEKTRLLGNGANDLKLFAISDKVLRPDIYTTSFLAVDSDAEKLPDVSIDDIQNNIESDSNLWIILVILLIIIIPIAIVKLRRKNSSLP